MSDRYADHRKRLAEVIGPDGVAIVPSGREVIRNHDVAYAFRQDSAFWYLTGFEEPGSVAVIAPGHDDGDFALFVRPRNPDQEVWTGIRAGTKGAEAHYAADAAYRIDQLDEVLERYVFGREVLWYAPGNPAFDERISRIIQKARAVRERHGYKLPSAIKDLSVPLGEMMLLKSGAEVSSIRHACMLSAEGHAEAMRFAEPGMFEYQVQAALEYFWRLGGSPRNGYPSIVASGANACVLHYVTNDSRIADSDLVLIDAGAEIDGYSADITRTFPASGQFTGPQRAVYEVVLEAERKGVEMSAPGTTMRSIHDSAVRVLTEGMVELGLLPLSVEESVAMAHYRQFFMHGTGHWLGLDVHDRGSYRIDGMDRQLEPGMTFTVEPGIYVSTDKGEIELPLLQVDVDARAERRARLGAKAAAALEAEEEESSEKLTHRVPEEFIGLGVRIEDDIVITDQGHENLSESVPVDIEDVELLCAEKSRLPAG